MTKFKNSEREDDQPMDLQAIQNNPAFRQLASERARLGVGMSVVMATTYFAYILTIAFRPGLLGHPLWNGTVITWGVLIGVGLIALGFFLTALYVRRANSRFDRLSQLLRENLR
ncbi:DUF485 domain-containing protein [Bradyrhizobium sp. CCBAU 11386]|uniref:DUF485 domain-containing protein n=1 Tax=Bradyrhizobium sp. CCBAU 11386 TaxID=1630837 RepID=UPI002303E4BE|nr:DUF485 domain-containing protein [Bradyrhizobium sp. CCBAU 11386]